VALAEARGGAPRGVRATRRRRSRRGRDCGRRTEPRMLAVLLRGGSRMQRTLIAAAAIVATLLAATVTALAALPKKGGVYVATVKSSPFEMAINLGVTPSGTKARFTYLCGTGRAPTVVFGVPIDSKGYFK